MSKKTSTFTKEGTELYTKKQYSEALASFNKAIELDPEDPSGWFGKGGVLDSLGQYEEALISFDKAIELTDKITFKWAYPWNAKGCTLINLERYGDAIKEFDKALELDPKFSLAWNGRGTALLQLGRKDEALNAFDNAIENDHKYADPWLGRGNVLDSLGMYPEAIDSYDNAIKLDPTSAKPWYGKGNSLHHLGRYKDAIDAHFNATHLDPQLSPAWNGLGNALFRLERHEEAIDSYDRSIDTDTKFASPWNGKGNALFRLGRHEEAIESYDRSIDIDSMFANPWYGKGITYLDVNQFDRAVPCLLRSFFLSSNISDFQDIQVLKLSINLLWDKFYCPLLIYRFLNQNPMLMTELSWVQLIGKVLGVSLPVLDFLNLITSNDNQVDEIEKDKTSGLVSYYMGDPINSYEIFDELDKKVEQNMMIQYYLIISGDAFHNDTGSTLNYALQDAEKVLKSPISSQKQLYYTGNILYDAWKKLNLPEYLQNALLCFEKAEDFLPAHYMRALCLDNLKLVEEKDKIIKDIILVQERELHKSHKRGYLDSVTLYEVEIDSSDLGQPFQKYAHYIEISEAIILVQEWLNEFEEKVGGLPKGLEFLDRQEQTLDQHDILAWKFLENAKNELNKQRTTLLEKNKEAARMKLLTYFEQIPLIDSDLDYHETEMKLAELIENDESKDPSIKYRLLIELLYYNNKLSAQSAILLDFFATLKAQSKKEGFLLRYNESIDEAFRNSFIGILGASVAIGSSYFVPIIVTSAGAAFYPLLRATIKNYFSKDDELTYASLKSKFTNHIARLMDKHGESFETNYPLPNFNDWSREVDFKKY